MRLHSRSAATATRSRPPACAPFPADADRAFLADYLGAGLYRGHSVYMPPVPLPEAERGALAAYIESILPKKGAAK